MCLPLLAPIGVALGAAAGSGAAATLGTVATASVLAGAVGAYGAYQQGQSGKAMNSFQANMLQQQAVLAQRNAEENTTLVQGQAAEQSKVSARRTAEIAGAQTAAMAANGTAGGTTASDIKVDTFDTGKLDQMAIQYNADVKSWGIKNQLGGELWNLDAEEKQYRMAGRNAATAGNIGVGSSILSTASQVGNTKLMSNYYAGGSRTLTV